SSAASASRRPRRASTMSSSRVIMAAMRPYDRNLHRLAARGRLVRPKTNDAQIARGRSRRDDFLKSRQCIDDRRVLHLRSHRAPIDDLRRGQANTLEGRIEAASRGKSPGAAVTLAAFEQSAQAVPGAVSIGCDAGYHSTWLEHAMSLSEQTVEIGNDFQQSD